MKPRIDPKRSAVLVLGWLLLKNGLGWWRQIRAQPRAVPLLGISSLLIAFNWGLYIWAVNAGHVVETSLGYFINPLINVVLGVLVPQPSAAAATHPHGKH